MHFKVVIYQPFNDVSSKFFFCHEKAFFRALSYPPDSNYGIFVAGPVMSIQLDENVYRQFSDIYGSFNNNEEERFVHFF